MRSLLFILLALLLAPLRAAPPQTITLYGDDNYPPYSYVEYGQFKGLYVDLLRQLSSELKGYNLELKPLPWRRALSMLERNRISGLFPPYQLAGRDYIRAYSQPLFEETIILLCRADVMQSPRPRFPDDFRDLRIGVNSGFLLDEALRAAQKSGLIKLEESATNNENLLKLAYKRIDCYANDRLAIRFSLQILRGERDTAPLLRDFHPQEATILAKRNAHIGYSADTVARHPELIRQLDHALQGAARKQSLQQLMRFYALPPP